MTRSMLVLVFATCSYLIQAQTITEINQYVDEIDEARHAGKLVKYRYPNMSFCSGALRGYYHNDKLVYIDAVYGAEVGYSSRRVYLMDTLPVKIIYREHFADWDAYELKYPNEEEFNEEHMIFTDTLYTFWIGNKTIMYKSAGKKMLSKNTVDEAKLQRLKNCVVTMRNELAKEKELD